MTGPQFEYGGYTLDELRSLAASPQVGTMQAMPASFRALADRVGEVADLLSHAQADLPNWWKGPAAEQAAAALGRAAAEAREFHGSATAAASAVSRCAQVVAEQQNQMMGVPDVQEPGVTAVVQRPATPFEALEAARQDAAYQAAHERAVQVVNGMAAQYVETRSELALITNARGENFVAPTEIQKAFSPITEESPHNSPANAELGRATSRELTERQYEPLATSSSSMGGRAISGGRQMPTTGEAPWPSPLPTTLVEAHIEPKSTPKRTQGFASTLVADAHNGTFENVAHNFAPTDTLSRLPEGSQDANGYRSSPGPASSVSHTGEDHPSETLGNIYDPVAIPANTSPLEPYPEATNRPLSGRSSRPQPNKSTRVTENSNIDFDRGSSRSRSNEVGSDSSRLVNFQPSTPSSVDNTANDNSTMIPPYSGVGSVGRGRERNPRPAYLKERKGVWLPDTVAAPADGVIRPD